MSNDDPPRSDPPTRRNSHVVDLYEDESESSDEVDVFEDNVRNLDEYSEFSNSLHPSFEPVEIEVPISALSTYEPEAHEFKEGFIFTPYDEGTDFNSEQFKKLQLQLLYESRIEQRCRKQFAVTLYIINRGNYECNKYFDPDTESSSSSPSAFFDPVVFERVYHPYSEYFEKNYNLTVKRVEFLRHVLREYYRFYKAFKHLRFGNYAKLFKATFTSYERRDLAFLRGIKDDDYANEYYYNMLSIPQHFQTILKNHSFIQGQLVPSHLDESDGVIKDKYTKTYVPYFEHYVSESDFEYVLSLLPDIYLLYRKANKNDLFLYRVVLERELQLKCKENYTKLLRALEIFVGDTDPIYEPNRDASKENLNQRRDKLILRYSIVMWNEREQSRKTYRERLIDVLNEGEPLVNEPIKVLGMYRRQSESAMYVDALNLLQEFYKIFVEGNQICFSTVSLSFLLKEHLINNIPNMKQQIQSVMQDLNMVLTGSCEFWPFGITIYQLKRYIYRKSMGCLPVMSLFDANHLKHHSLAESSTDSSDDSNSGSESSPESANEDTMEGEDNLSLEEKETLLKLKDAKNCIVRRTPQFKRQRAAKRLKRRMKERSDSKDELMKNIKYQPEFSMYFEDYLDYKFESVGLKNRQNYYRKRYTRFNYHEFVQLSFSEDESDIQDNEGRFRRFYTKKVNRFYKTGVKYVRSNVTPAINDEVEDAEEDTTSELVRSDNRFSAMHQNRVYITPEVHAAPVTVFGGANIKHRAETIADNAIEDNDEFQNHSIREDVLTWQKDLCDLYESFANMLVDPNLRAYRLAQAKPSALKLQQPRARPKFTYNPSSGKGAPVFDMKAACKATHEMTKHNDLVDMQERERSIRVAAKRIEDSLIREHELIMVEESYQLQEQFIASRNNRGVNLNMNKSDDMDEDYEDVQPSSSSSNKRDRNLSLTSDAKRSRHVPEVYRMNLELPDAPNNNTPEEMKIYNKLVEEVNCVNSMSYVDYKAYRLQQFRRGYKSTRDIKERFKREMALKTPPQPFYGQLVPSEEEKEKAKELEAEIIRYEYSSVKGLFEGGSDSDDDESNVSLFASVVRRLEF